MSDARWAGWVLGSMLAVVLLAAWFFMSIRWPSLDEDPPVDGTAPAVSVSVTPTLEDRGWPEWPSRREIARLAAAVEWATFDHAPEPEPEVSSVAIERQPSGEIVVTNPPEAPVAPGELADLICSYSWDCATALRVAHCESRFDPNAVGRAGERGLFQIFPRWHTDRIARLGFTVDDLFDPAVNVAVAYDLWSEQGWQRPWSCAR